MASSVITGQLPEWIEPLQVLAHHQSNVHFRFKQQGMHLLGLHLHDCHDALAQHAASESFDTCPHVQLTAMYDPNQFVCTDQLAAT